MSAAPAIELKGVTKRYPGVVANKDVGLEVGSGEVHAIVGENGAGKSTLMKILYGMVRPDEGTISIGGARSSSELPRTPSTPGSGWSTSISCSPTTSPSSKTSSSAPSPGPASRSTSTTPKPGSRDSASPTGSTRPHERVEKLGVGERQRVEIIKVLYRGACILILDEPTAVLVPQEVDELFDEPRELKEEGHTVIFISHKLDEVLSIADRITVMRAGKTVGTATPQEVDAHSLPR